LSFNIALSLPFVIIVATGFLLEAQPPQVLNNVIVYREAGRYGGWPANHGIWSWGSEILVGFEAGYFRANETTHAIDRTKPEEHLLARSLDGGKSWKIEKPESLKAPPGSKMNGTPVEAGGKLPVACPGGIDFLHPGLAMTVRMEDTDAGPSRFYYSYDRGKNWQGPFTLPDLGQKGILGRTDYVVESQSQCLLFVAATKQNGKEGHALCMRTKNGGKSWNLVSFIGPEPEDYSIMPSTVRVGGRSLVTAIRRKRWIEIYRTDDEGASWNLLTKTAENGGNPPSMIRLKDDRLALTYGYRLEPYGIRARFSSDEGRTWGDEFILRQDGGTWDLGYPRTVQRPDGNLVTVYYFADSKNNDRYIAATIWNPGQVR
jgi:hypothetical protein